MAAQVETHFIAEEAWLKSNYVELGINKKGVFGTDISNKPPNFKDNRNTTNKLFGFIANPQQDGWVDYDGDFFTPRDPEEGFTLSIGSENYSNNNRIEIAEIPGEIKEVSTVTSSCFEKIAIANWVGSIDNINIKRSYVISENGLFIKMQTTLTNTSSDIKKEVYFAHNLDPDNNYTLSGNFSTDLEIVSQPSELNNLAIVKASQNGNDTPLDVDGSVVSFYADDERAKVSYGGFSNRNAKDIWNGFLLNNTTGQTSYFDQAMSIAFYFEDIQPGEKKEFTYYYVLQKIDEFFLPTVISSSYQNPTKCNTKDGSIFLSGFLPSRNYTIEYLKNGISVPSKTFTSNANGEIIISDLSDAAYSNFTINSSACNTIYNNTIRLEVPFKPVMVPEKTNPRNCEGNNGKIALTNLFKGEQVEMSYQKNNLKIPPTIFTVNENGEIILDNLTNGKYANFRLRYLTTECAKTFNNEIILKGSSPSEPSSKVNEQTFCEVNLNDKTELDLSYIDELLRGNLSKEKYTISYHLSQEDAENNIEVSKKNFSINGNYNFDLYFRMENNTSQCFEVGSFPIAVKNAPNFQISNGYMCMLEDDTVDPNYNIELNTTLNEDDYRFEWSFNDEKLSNQNRSTFTPKKPGIYNVKIISKTNKCIYNRNVEVLKSGKPKNVDISLISGFLTPNQRYLIRAIGYGNYEYKLNDAEYQDKEIFENVPFGNNSFYVNDKNGCGEILIKKQSLNYPLYFTPNNDGKNDYWQVEDVKSLNNAIIHIMDRYGKLLKTLTAEDKGWDGTYEGKKVLANDYWFVLYYNNENDITEKIQGHFSLVR